MTNMCATRCCVKKCRGVECLWQCFRVLGRKVSGRVSSSGTCHSCCLIAHFGERYGSLHDYIHLKIQLTYIFQYTVCFDLFFCFLLYVFLFLFFSSLPFGCFSCFFLIICFLLLSFP